MRITALLLLSALTAVTWAAPRPTEIIETIDQYRIVLYLTEPQINAMAEWRPGQGEPPMSIGRAVNHVRDWIASDPSLAGARIYELEYKPIHNHEKLNRWYYLVELRLTGGEKRFVAVLPGGKVVPAIEEPGS